MNLRIIKPGVMDTVQDMGRYGWQHLGINPGGAMDKLSAQIANILVGNETNEAVIELHFPAAAFFFEQPSLIAISGADFSANVNGEEVPGMRPILVSKYSILQFHGVKNGARSYLAVHGGLAIPSWLNSFSTLIKAGAGGFKGRALQKDDEIGFRTEVDLSRLLAKKEFEILPWKADDDWGNNNAEQILALPGHEWNRLNDHSKQKFFDQAFLISGHSDRMGYHLKGDALSTIASEEAISSAVSFGTVQLDG